MQVGDHGLVGRPDTRPHAGAETPLVIGVGRDAVGREIMPGRLESVGVVVEAMQRQHDGVDRRSGIGQP